MAISNSRLGEIKPKHPGVFIKDVLMKNRELSLDDLAKQIDLPKEEIGRIIAGEADVTRDVRDHFRLAFSQVAKRLFQLQLAYDFYRQNGRKASREEKRTLFANSLD